MMTRRAVVGAAPALLLGAPVAAAGVRRNRVAQGARIGSDSIQMSVISPDGRTGFAVRLARYPSVDAAWVWAVAYTPDGVWCYADDRLNAAVPLADDASRRVLAQRDGADITISRAGNRANATEVTLEATLRCFADPDAPRGQGPVRVAIAATMRPALRSPGVLADRTESAGAADFTLTIDGRAVRGAGLGHVHEQPQAAARFVDPFSYLRLLGNDVAATLLLSKAGSGGYVETPSGVRTVTRFTIARPGRTRQFALTVDGRELSGVLRETHHYTVPIYDGRRQSRIVTTTLDGIALVGESNDWLPDRLAYA